MQHFRKKQQFKRRLYSKLVLILLFVALLFVAHGTWGIFQKARQSKQLLERAQAEKAELAEKQAAIEYRIDRMKTQTGIEEEIRSKFDVAREGEQLIVIVENEEEVEIEEEESKGISGFFTTLFSWMQ